MNVFVVIEAGDDHVSLVDGDRFEVLHRFPSRRLQDHPAFSPDGRFLYLASRDGWIAKYDIRNLTLVAEVRAGLELNGLAASADGRWVMAANTSPPTLALFDPDLHLERTYALATLDGRLASPAAAVYDAPPRQSFIVALKDIAELWEISYNVRAEPIFDGLVHDYRMREGIAKPGYLGVRRIPLEAPMEALIFEPSYRNAIGASRPARGGAAKASVVNLDVRRVIAVIPAPGVAQLEGGVVFSRKDGAVLAYPSLSGAEVIVVDAKTWRITGTIPVPGTGARLSAHQDSPDVWVNFGGDASSMDAISLFHKQDLTTAGEVREPGRRLSHVEFNRDGQYVLVSIGEAEGAVVVFDARTRQEVKRLPMRSPAGSYNVGNRVGRGMTESRR